ncbi:hypothetical protein BGZ65_006396, partial [Modicella reniformis]
AFKEYVAKRMTAEEYATICNIVTQGFVELSIEILALEAHLGGPNHAAAMNASGSTITPTNVSSSPVSSSEPPSSSPAGVAVTDNTTTDSSTETRQCVSLNSTEHAQLVREVQLLEKQKLTLTVQGQKWVLAKEAQENQDQKEREAELQADRIMNGSDEDESEGGQQGQAEAEAQAQANGSIKLSAEEWQAKLDGNRDRLNEVVEAINDKLADIQEAIAVLAL